MRSLRQPAVPMGFGVVGRGLLVHSLYHSLGCCAHWCVEYYYKYYKYDTAHSALMCTTWPLLVASRYLPLATANVPAIQATSLIWKRLAACALSDF